MSIAYSDEGLLLRGILISLCLLEIAGWYVPDIVHHQDLNLYRLYCVVGLIGSLVVFKTAVFTLLAIWVSWDIVCTDRAELVASYRNQ